MAWLKRILPARSSGLARRYSTETVQAVQAIVSKVPGISFPNSINSIVDQLEFRKEVIVFVVDAFIESKINSSPFVSFFS